MAGIDEIFTVAAQHSMIDTPRLISLYRLACQMPSRGDVVEVGTWRGGSGVLLATAARTVQSAPRVWLCDTFCGVPSVSAEDRQAQGDYQVGEHADCAADEVRALLESLQLPGHVVEGVFPASFVALAPCATAFAFAHLDCDVYESMRDSLAYIWPRLVEGGLVVCDDYEFARTPGVRRAVHALQMQVGMAECLLSVTPYRQAILVKRRRTEE